MARTRGAKSSSHSSRKRVLREAPVQGPTSEPPRPEAASLPAKPAPQKPPARRYLTRSGGHPLQKKARVESSDLRQRRHLIHAQLVSQLIRVQLVLLD
uniref:Uncharacterized protein n=1 Tax=Vitis vinifera TaxID=29760 RepID=A5B1F2_VITVI|nr:hypothetical protein VITISV_034231 [Vitis vinifera]